MTAATQLLFLAAVLAVFWFLMIRPARKAQRAQMELIASLEVGDEVVLNSGIFGRIASIEDNTAGVEIAPGTVVKVAIQVVVRRVEDAAEDETETVTGSGPAQAPGSDVTEEN